MKGTGYVNGSDVVVHHAAGNRGHVRSRRLDTLDRRVLLPWGYSKGAAMRSTPLSPPASPLQVVEPHLNGPAGEVPIKMVGATKKR